MPHTSYTTQILQCTTAGVTSLRANKDSFLLGVNLKVGKKSDNEVLLVK